MFIHLVTYKTTGHHQGLFVCVRTSAPWTASKLFNKLSLIISLMIKSYNLKIENPWPNVGT